MPPATLHRASQGFALVEALASLVIVAMMGLLLVAGLTTGRRVWDRLDTREAAGETLDAAQSLVRDRLEQAYPQTLYDENPPYVDFQGRAQSVVFLANPPAAQRPAPLRRYTLDVDTGGRLVLSSVSDVGPVERQPVKRETLLSGVRQIDLAYFGPAQPDFQHRWRPIWRDNTLLPELVRLRLTFEPNDPRHWADLIVRPRTTIDSACLLNTISHRCKGRL